MLIAMALSASTLVKAAPVNCEPWSVLKISGKPCLTKASCSVSMQNAASIVIDTRHDNTRRLAQSSTTAR
jgi:type 1 fimbria pilin